MQAVLTLVFLAFIVGSLCNVIGLLLHSSHRAVRFTGKNLRRRNAMKPMRQAVCRERDVLLVR